MKPLITVIVPVYNGQDYLLSCINCIQDQTYDNIEIIVVDDGSKDGTPAVCRELEARYADSASERADQKRSFRCITLGDEGVSAARNSALELASGEYVTFVDADDRIVPGMLQHLYELMSGKGCDAAGCCFFMWSSEEEWRAHASGEEENYEIRSYGPDEFARRILRGNTRCWSKLYRRDVLQNVRFEPGLTIGEDMLFLVMLREHITSVCESTFQGYGYYQNASGAMQRKFSIHAMDQIYCWEKARELLGASPAVDRHIVVSVLLTAGRMAGLDRAERQKYAGEAGVCRQKLREYLTREVYGMLDGGYKVKAALFLAAPRIYMDLYHLWKRP